MTTSIAQRSNSPQLNKPQINSIVIFIAAIGIAAMTIVTQPFSTDAPPTPSDIEWCCLGSKPADEPGRLMTDVDEVTSSVENSPRTGPLALRSVGLDPGAIDELIGGTVYAEVRHAHSSSNHVR